MEDGQKLLSQLVRSGFSGTPGNAIFIVPALTNVTVNSSNNLTGNAAFVAVLYNDFLKRPGNTTNAADAGAWVNFLNSGNSQQVVANGISRSPEALGILFDS